MSESDTLKDQWENMGKPDVFEVRFVNPKEGNNFWIHRMNNIFCGLGVKIQGSTRFLIIVK